MSKSLLTLLLLAFFLEIVAPSSVVLAASPDIYSDGELAALANKSLKEYKKLYGEKKKRDAELKDLASNIQNFEGQVQRAKKKRDRTKAQNNLNQVLKRQKVLKDKNKHFAPQMAKHKKTYQTHKKAYQQRQQEKQMLPKGKPTTWTSEEANTALKVHATWVKRARKRLQYYENQLNTTASSVTVAAKRQNKVSELKGDLKQMEQKYWQIDSIVRELKYQNQLVLNRPNPIQETPPPENTPQNPSPEYNLKAVETSTPEQIPAFSPKELNPSGFKPQNLQTSPRVLTTPPPEPQEKDFISGLNRLFETHPIGTILIAFIAAFSGLFVSMTLTDPNNPRHSPQAALAIAAGIGLVSALPFFGLILGFLGLFLSFFVYYRLSLEKFTKALPISLALFASVGALGTGILWLIDQMHG